jgi:hypothetical protein
MMTGNGFVFGKDGCHVMTNFHVAFAKTKDSEGKIVFVDNIDVGHPVLVMANIQSNGKMTKLKGKVVEYGNYNSRRLRGRSEDIAIIKLDTCLGPEFGIARIDNPKREVTVPQTAIATLSLEKIDAERSVVMHEEECFSFLKAPTRWVFFQTCATLDGMSGSPIFRKDADGGYTIVGMTTGSIFPPDGEPIKYAVYASGMVRYIRTTVGDDVLVGSQEVESQPIQAAQAPQGRYTIR